MFWQWLWPLLLLQRSTDLDVMSPHGQQGTMPVLPPVCVPQDRGNATMEAIPPTYQCFARPSMDAASSVATAAASPAASSWWPQWLFSRQQQQTASMPMWLFNDDVEMAAAAAAAAAGDDGLHDIPVHEITLKDLLEPWVVDINIHGAAMALALAVLVMSCTYQLFQVIHPQVLFQSCIRSYMQLRHGSMDHDELHADLHDPHTPRHHDVHLHGNILEHFHSQEGDIDIEVEFDIDATDPVPEVEFGSVPGVEHTPGMKPDSGAGLAQVREDHAEGKEDEDDGVDDDEDENEEEESNEEDFEDDTEDEDNNTPGDEAASRPALKSLAASWQREGYETPPDDASEAAAAAAAVVSAATGADDGNEDQAGNQTIEGAVLELMANPPKRSPDTAAASPKAAAASPSAKPAAGGSDSKETTSPEDAARAANMPIILLLGIDGLTGAGKSTLCRELKTRVIREGYTPHILYEDISGKVFQDLLHAASEKPERFEAIKQAVFIGNRTRRVAETLEHIQGNAKPGSVHVIVVDRTWFGDMTMAKAANLDEVSAAALSQLTKDLAYFQYSFSFVYCIRKHTKTIAAQIKERGRVFEQGRNGLTHKKLHAQTEAYRDIVRRLMRQEGLNLRESSRSDETRQHADNCMRVLKKLLQNMQG